MEEEEGRLGEEKAIQGQPTLVEEAEEAERNQAKRRKKSRLFLLQRIKSPQPSMSLAVH